MHYKGSSWSGLRRGRVLAGALTLAATAAAGILAASAMPAFAGGGNGHGGGNGNGNGQGQSAAASHGKGHGGGGSSGGSGGSGGSGPIGHNNGGGNAGGNGHGATHVKICHATPPDTAAGGYVVISPSTSGVYHGHLRQHDADIIPPFTYDGVQYSLNWDATGQAIWNNGCIVPTSGTSTPAPTNPTPTNPTPTNPTPTNPTPTNPTPTLGLSIVKWERVGTTGSFSRGPVTAAVGDTIFYEIFVVNTSTVPLAVTLSDPHCDAGTLLPSGTATLAAGAEEEYTCSHVLTSADGSVYYNVATASGYSSSVNANVRASSHVQANVAASGVAGAHKTVTKKVTHKARPSRAAVKGASYTG